MCVCVVKTATINYKTLSNETTKGAQPQQSQASQNGRKYSNTNIKQQQQKNTTQIIPKRITSKAFSLANLDHTTLGRLK